jgi:hypothetical protein
LITRLFGSLLPGLRDARTPLVTGLLWLLFCWILLASVIAQPQSATPFVRQVFEVLSAVGNGTTIAAVLGVGYVVGVLGVTAAQSLRGVLSTLRNRIPAAFRWQRAAHAKRRQLRTELAGIPAEIKNEPKVAARIDKIQKDLAALDGRWWIGQTRQAVGALGRSGGRDPIYHSAEIALTNAYERGVDKDLQRRNTDISSRHLDDSEVGLWTEDLVDRDLGDDPLDALRALDEGLFQAFDRERAEGEFRIGVTPPVMAIAIHLALTATPWAYIVAAFSFVTFWIAAGRESGEKARILNQLVLKGLPLPTVDKAERAGRIAVRDYGAKSPSSTPGSKTRDQLD